MAAQSRLSQTSRHAWLALGTLAVSVGLFSSAEAGQADRYAAHMAESLAEIRANTDAVLSKHSERNEVKDYRQRLALIDKAALALAERIRKVQSEALARMLGDTPKVKPGGVIGVGMPSVSADAAKIYSKFCGPLRKPLALPDIPETEKALLRRYYVGSFAEAEKYVARLGAAATALEREAKQEVLELCTVLPLLRTPDSTWSMKEIDELPAWMTKQQSLKILESFAVSIPRPLTALAMAQRATARTWTPAEKCNYLAGILQQLAAAQDYPRAKFWCEALIRLAEELAVREQAMAARCQMAEFHEKSGSPLLAALEAKSAMDAHPESGAWGRAAMLRLKSLYAAGRLKEAVRDAQEYIADDRAKAFLPQIIYISWVASRRQGETDSAAQLQKRFLEQFPEHLLGADMHFASAMTALANGDYDEAARLLEIVEYRYSNSRIVDKAKAIQERLAKSRK